MDLLTFGSIILFEGAHYVWLVSDAEEGKIHLARILDVEHTKELLRLDAKNEKKLRSASDSPIFAYVVLTTDDFNGCAAHLMNSGEHTDNADGVSLLGQLNQADAESLKGRIIEGTGLSARLISLIKKL